MGATAEQLRAAATVPAYGRQLVEVFSVRAVSGGARRPPCGTVSVFDGKRGQVVYSRGARDQPTLSHAQDQLLLTGPYRAISADGSVAIELDLDDGSQEPPPSSREAATISWDAQDPGAEYDRPISRTAGTRYGPAEVVYAVLSNAVEGSVEVSSRDDDGAACVHGRIVARSELFDDDVGVVLFDDDGSSCSCGGARTPQESTVIIPLARSVLAVPLVWPLTIEADLRAHSGDKILEGSLRFYPELDGQHVKQLIGRNGGIQVKITWSD